MEPSEQEQAERLSRAMKLVPKAEDVVSADEFTADSRFPEAVRTRVSEMKARDKELAASTLSWDMSGGGRMSKQQIKLRRKLELRNMQRHQANPFQNWIRPIAMPEGSPVFAAMAEDSAGLEKMLQSLIVSMRSGQGSYA